MAEAGGLVKGNLSAVKNRPAGIATMAIFSIVAQVVGYRSGGIPHPIKTAGPIGKYEGKESSSLTHDVILMCVVVGYSAYRWHLPLRFSTRRNPRLTKRSIAL